MKSVSPRNFLLFWLTFLSLAALILFTTLMDSAPLVPLVFLGLAVAFAALWLVLRTGQGQNIPHVGLSWVWLIGLVAAILSTLLSPNPRMGVERLLWLGTAVFVFYFLLCVFRSDVDAQPVLDGALWASGFVILSACTETTAWYAVWRDMVGSAQIEPLYPYRFSSLLGHANVYMGFVNLWAPVAVGSFVQARTRVRRIFLLLWLALYLVSVPLSSSRGGWVGMVTWIGLLVLLWALTQAWFPRVWASIRRRWMAAVAAAFVLMGMAVVGYLLVSKSVTSHPTHGSSLFGSRDAFVQAALRAWQISPWGGMGPGRFAFGWLEQAGSIPPGWWPQHSHNLWTQALAEFGPLGLVGLCALLFVGGLKLGRAWRSAPMDRKWAASTAIAGLGAWLVHSLVDEFTSLTFVVTSLAILAAYGLTRGLDEARPGKWMLGWLLLPLALLAGVGGWSLWSSYPARAAAIAGEQGRWLESIAGFETSLNRDPTLPFYSFQTGFARAMLWQESGDAQSLTLARESFVRGLRLESALIEMPWRRKEDGYALWWANLAVLDFQAGEAAQAEAHIRRAVAIAPGEATFHLNLGWMMEAWGREDEALAAYGKALEIKPEWASHPFWRGSSLREQAALGAVELDKLPTSLYLDQAAEALEAGDWTGTRRALAFSALAGEPGMARLVLETQLAHQTGDEVAALEGLRTTVARRQLSGVSVLSFNEIYVRKQLPMNIVPGYIQLEGDYGQFQALGRLYDLEAEQGDCEAAARTWATWQQALLGFAPQPIPPAPACP